jgi:ferredoxin-NADP reductase
MGSPHSTCPNRPSALHTHPTRQLTPQTYEKGNISRHLANLKVGDTVQVKGPKGKFMYAHDLSPHLLMIAGGTGITPMYQIIKSSLKNATDKTRLALIYANVDESDIREWRRVVGEWRVFCPHLNCASVLSIRDEGSGGKRLSARALSCWAPVIFSCSAVHNRSFLHSPRRSCT